MRGHTGTSLQLEMPGEGLVGIGGLVVPQELEPSAVSGEYPALDGAARQAVDVVGRPLPWWGGFDKSFKQHDQNRLFQVFLDHHCNLIFNLLKIW